MKTIDRLFIFLSLLVSVQAREPIAAKDHLQPMARYSGEWRWHWKNEHAEPMEGFSSVSLDSSGAFLIDRGGDVQDGKAIPKEFNLYFWHPARREIMTCGFTADDEHGSSVVAVRRNQWIEQSSGYDAQGKLRTHVDQWEWIDLDTAAYQETHIFHAGEPEPDDFKLTCKRATPEQTAALKLVETTSTHATLQPLSSWLGKWDLDWKDDQGQPHHGRASITSEAGGAILVETARELREGAASACAIRIFYWQPETHSFASLAVDSSGMVSSAQLFPDKDAWVSQVSAWTAEGNYQTSIGRHEKADPDTITYGEVNLYDNGKALPDRPKLTYTRVKE